MSTLNIPAINIPVDTNVFGPIPTGVGLNKWLLTLDIANLVARCDFIVEIALDGIDWHIEGQLDASGPSTNRDGTPNNNISMGSSLGTDGNDAQGNPIRVVTNSNTLVRFTTNNTLAFHSNGGTLAVS